MTVRGELPRRTSASRLALAGIAALSLLALQAIPQWAQAASPVSPGQGGTAGSAVVIEDFTFHPAVLTVPAGTTVTWTNREAELHTVTSTTKLFASSGLDSGDTFSFQFMTPGTYEYYCALHPHMTGTIIVK
jgi:plastocyanin